MRTTITLDPDVEQLLKEAMHQKRQSFKKTLNDAIRAGLTNPASPKKFKVKASNMELHNTIDPTSFNHLADVLELEDSQKVAEEPGQYPAS